MTDKVYQQIVSPFLRLPEIRGKGLVIAPNARLLWRRGTLEVLFALERDFGVKRLSWLVTDSIGDDSVTLYSLDAECEDVAGSGWTITRCEVPDSVFAGSLEKRIDAVIRYLSDALPLAWDKDSLNTDCLVA